MSAGAPAPAPVDTHAAPALPVRWAGWLLVAALLLAGVAALPQLSQAAQRNVDALRTLHSLFDDDPATRNASSSPYLAGLNHWLDGDLAAAERAFAQAAPIERESACRYRLLGFAQARDWASAASLADTCANPLHVDLFLRTVAANWAPYAEADAAAVAQVIARASPPGLAQAASLLYAQGAYAEAERWTRLVLQQGRNDAAALILSLSLFQQRRFAEAVPELERYIAAQPAEPMGWYWLGRAQRALGQTDRAVDSFVQALAVSTPDDPRRVYFLTQAAAVLAELARCDEARARLASADSLANDASRMAVDSVRALVADRCRAP